MEETITLKEIIGVLKKRMALIISLIIAAAGISALVSYFALTPTYEASSQFIVSQNNELPEGAYDVNQIRSNVEIINTYNVIIKSPRILEPVAEATGLSLTADQLSEQIAVSSAEDSQVVTVTATDTDQETAALIANTTVEVFQKTIPELMNVNNVSILSSANVEADPIQVSPDPMLNIAIAVVLGAMAGAGIAFLLDYLDNTVKTEEDIERKLEMPVLGVVSHVSDEDIKTGRAAITMPIQGRGGNLDGKKKSS